MHIRKINVFDKCDDANLYVKAGKLPEKDLCSET